MDVRCQSRANRSLAPALAFTSDIRHPKSDISPNRVRHDPLRRRGLRRDGQAPPDDVKERRTACISSQVGCPVGCKFCASGIGGLDGNLTAGRIVEQVWLLQPLEGVGRITNVVFMGMGEPLSNFANVARACARSTRPRRTA